MKNRATYIMIITIAMIMTAISVGGCFTSCNSEPTYELVPTTTTTTEATTTTIVETTIETKETTVETSETTEEITETIENSTIESTVESNYKNNDIDFGNDKKAAETHKENKGGKVTTTKAPTKKPEPTKKPATSTKKPEPTKKPTTTKAPTNTPKPTEKPKPTATPVPSKGTAIVKIKTTSRVYVDDESDETENKVDYFEIEATTSKWHTKTLSSYKYDGKVIDKKLRNKYGDNLQGYSAKVVEIVKFTN